MNLQANTNSEDIIELLNFWKSFIDSQFENAQEFIEDMHLLADEYTISKKDTYDPGLNAFIMISDLYHRENFHSDILKTFLSKDEAHNENLKFLYNFINVINKVNPQHFITKYDYNDAIVIREKTNIDILIIADSAKKAILIENKINNAIDQPRQLPRYLEAVSKEYKVEAVVYITLDVSKSPAKHDWNTDELKKINPILKIIPAFDQTAVNLYNDWIVPCVMEAKGADSTFILRQYGNLLKYLNSNTMDTVSLEKFYNNLLNGDNLKTAESIRNMLNDLPEYMAIRIQDKYRDHCYPFSKVWRYQQRDCVFEAFRNGAYSIKMDIWCGEYGYKIHVWNPTDEYFDIKLQLPQIKCLADFTYYNGNISNVTKTFSFNGEDAVFDFIDELIIELRAIATLS